MSPRSGNRRRYDDDPYVFDDPYTHTSPQNLGSPAYEYVGTDEPLTPGRGPSPREERRRRPSPSRRYSRTTSPPRHSRRRRAEDNYPSPPPEPNSPRHASSPRNGDRQLPHDSRHKNKKHRYQDIKQNPTLQTYGRKGLNFLGEAAAAYAAAQAAENGEEPPPPPRSRSVDHHDEDRRRTRHHRRYTPSPSPSPPRRRHTTRHGDSDRDRDRDRDAERERRRHSTYHGSPPPLSRDPDSYIASERRKGGRDREDRGYQSDNGDRDRGRHRQSSRRHYPSPSPSRSSRSPSSPRSRSTRTSRRRDRDRDLARSERGRDRDRNRDRARSEGFRSHVREELKPPPEAPVAQRWQMAARAALEAGGLTAMRLRKQPGSWSGDKAAKVATAALGAAAIDAFVDRDPRQSRSGGRGVKGIAESALSGFVASQIMGHAASTKRGKSRFSWSI